MNTVYIVAIGDKYTRTLMAQDSLKAWERYCDRHNLNLHLQTKATFPFKSNSESIFMERFNAICHPSNDSILIADLDILPAPDAPNVFGSHSDKNITCRINPHWGFHHNVYSRWFNDAKHKPHLPKLPWPKFKDVNQGRGQWPAGDLWFLVSGALLLLPPNARRIFRDNFARMQEQTPFWELSFDEGVLAWWIAKFNREYDLGVDAFDIWKWSTSFPSGYFAPDGLMPPDCHMPHIHEKRLLPRYYTEWHILRTRRETKAGWLLWRQRQILHRLSRTGARVAGKLPAKTTLKRLLSPPPPAVAGIRRSGVTRALRANRGQRDFPRLRRGMRARHRPVDGRGGRGLFRQLDLAVENPRRH